MRYEVEVKYGRREGEVDIFSLSDSIEVLKGFEDLDVTIFDNLSEEIIFDGVLDIEMINTLSEDLSSN